MPIPHVSTLRPALRGRRGATLTEIMIVVIIMGLVAAMAMPKFSNWVSSLRAQGAASQLQADIAYTRMSAVREGRTAALRVTGTTGYSIVVENTDGSTLRTLRTVSLSGSYPGTTLAVATGTGTDVAFDSRGLLKTGGVTGLTLTRSSRSQSLSITALGKVTRGAVQ
jgi:prepilin-type N-terminal cleavage/methylation domain-containing protein